MKKALFNISGFVLQLAALLLLLVAFIAILYPAVLLVGGVIVLLAILLMFLYPSGAAGMQLKTLQSDSKNSQKGSSVASGPGGVGGKATPRGPTLRRRMLSRFATRQAWRALWMAIIAMLLSFCLMVLLKSISWFFYINPLDRELEPYRQIFRTHEAARQNSGADKIGPATETQLNDQSDVE